MEHDADDLEALVPSLEAAVDATPGIDSWCSGPDWILSVREGFAPHAEPLIVNTGDSFALLARYPAEAPSGSSDAQSIVAGFEPLWGFACPIIGPRPERVADAVVDQLGIDSSWSRLILPGLPDDLEMARVVAAKLSVLGSVGAAEGITRRVADLDGFESWLSRRSRVFRRNLRAASKRADAAGVAFVDVGEHNDLFDRLLSIEERSWKGRVGDGITGPAMREFYRAMIRRLQRENRCRALIARLDGDDVGYILGGVRGQRYRGLQLSYVDDVASLSIGHLLQLHELRRLCAERTATVYDLGMDMDYKTRWADRTSTSVTLVVDRAVDQ